MKHSRLLLTAAALTACALPLQGQSLLVPGDTDYEGDFASISLTNNSNNNFDFDDSIAFYTNTGGNGWWVIESEALTRGTVQTNLDRGSILASEAPSFSAAELSFDYDLGAAADDWTLNMHFFGLSTGGTQSIKSNGDGALASGNADITLLDEQDFTGGGSGSYTIASPVDLTGYDRVAVTFSAPAGSDNPLTTFPTVDNVAITAIPEPSSFALLAGALGLALVMIRRRG